MVLWLSVLTSIFGFLHKVLILKNKRMGWLFGFVSGLLFSGYFYSTNLKVLSISSISFTVLALYGLIFNKCETSIYIENFIRIITIIACLILSYATFNGTITILQLFASVFQIFGAYLLTHKKILYGWIGFLFAHSIIAYLSYQTNQTFFADFQVASAIIAVLGILESRQYRQKVTNC